MNSVPGKSVIVENIQALIKAVESGVNESIRDCRNVLQGTLAPDPGRVGLVIEHIDTSEEA
ncbi:hypothetical protein BH11PLA2_BH11PLA2_45930 [soil metagenome]